jgi:CO/xanthine dehydrogenase Mo-binding subunit
LPLSPGAIVTNGAVIADALHDVVGTRLLQLPITPAGIQEALD